MCNSKLTRIKKFYHRSMTLSVDWLLRCDLTSFVEQWNETCRWNYDVFCRMTHCLLVQPKIKSCRIWLELESNDRRSFKKIAQAQKNVRTYDVPIGRRYFLLFTKFSLSFFFCLNRQIVIHFCLTSAVELLISIELLTRRPFFTIWIEKKQQQLNSSAKRQKNMKRKLDFILSLSEHFFVIHLNAMAATTTSKN